MNDQLKKHWEDVYRTKSPYEVSWTEPKPERSLKPIHKALQAPKNSPIIDIGGGDSLLVDYLLDEGYSDITVLDISAKAIERAKNRLGEKAAKITWLVSDILHFEPENNIQSGTIGPPFHFLTTADRKSKYRYLVENAVADGHLIMGNVFAFRPWAVQRIGGVSI
ncbi:class I SAM-dependent methyltransferase [Paucibacter sp. O1-1]|nr:class I SAM-dependent methyltransferase [Paucibacter sp. O1-1]MDA3830715.1 class I SAM-dependent methyltransferase [Paucibacter sp. O1-1]